MAKHRTRKSGAKAQRPLQEQPRWQPIERLGLIARHIDGVLADAIEHYETLQEALPKPYVLDDYTIGRVIEVFTAQQDDLWLFDEQLRRWSTDQLTLEQRKEVERLIGQMRRLHEVIARVLSLADKLKEGTIEKELVKSDFEVGLEMLLEMPFGTPSISSVRRRGTVRTGCFSEKQPS